MVIQNHGFSYKYLKDIESVNDEDRKILYENFSYNTRCITQYGTGTDTFSIAIDYVTNTDIILISKPKTLGALKPDTKFVSHALSAIFRYHFWFLELQSYNKSYPDKIGVFPLQIYRYSLADKYIIVIVKSDQLDKIISMLRTFALRRVSGPSFSQKYSKYCLTMSECHTNCFPKIPDYLPWKLQ